MEQIFQIQGELRSICLTHVQGLEFSLGQSVMGLQVVGNFSRSSFILLNLVLVRLMFVTIDPWFASRVCRPEWHYVALTLVTKSSFNLQLSRVSLLHSRRR